ncbi:MAG TPA: hypothetical protein VNM16_10160 [Bacillota bacterium]|nr:hypothetical protein [Bacillota bacterium]
MDLSGLWHLVVSPVALAARTVGVYFAMLVGFRLFGKRELGQATIFDVAMVLLIANAVQNAMVGPDTSLLGGLVVAAVLLAMNALMAYLQVHDRWFRSVLEGKPTVLMSDGHWFDRALHPEGMDRGEVYAAVRESGVLRPEQVKLPCSRPTATSPWCRPSRRPTPSRGPEPANRASRRASSPAAARWRRGTPANSRAGDIPPLTYGRARWHAEPASLQTSSVVGLASAAGRTNRIPPT